MLTIFLLDCYNFMFCLTFFANRDILSIVRWTECQEH
ncbi:MAG: hypothetical protein K0S25_463 [Bacillus sp. (in: firmicutes)]|nr:hypothetical protein [Bacillus sp. (in: firmicutes)]